MENSPPGIQTMLSGALLGAGAAFGIVGRKFAFWGGGSGADAAKVGLAFGECVEALFHIAIPASNTRMPAAGRKRVRVGETACEGLMTLLVLPMTCACRLSESSMPYLD
jgi:hypothetical protein